MPWEALATFTVDAMGRIFAMTDTPRRLAVADFDLASIRYFRTADRLRWRN